MKVLQFPETILPDEPEANIPPDYPQHNPTGAALMHLDKFPPVAQNTNPVVNSPIAENKNNSQVLEQEALLSKLNDAITTANPSTQVKLNSIEDLNDFFTTRMSILNPNKKKKETTKKDATNQHLSEDVLNHITKIMTEKGYNFGVNQESGTFEFTTKNNT
jgi:hypothetical protein